MKATDRIRIFVYGSLLEGMYNYNALAQTKVKEVETAPEYELFTITGGYPQLLKGKETVKGELHDVTIEEFSRIIRMELGAGYKTEDIKLNAGTTELGFLFREEYIDGPRKLTKVPNGDWKKFVTNKIERGT